jgi:hypothetical protein
MIFLLKWEVKRILWAVLQLQEIIEMTEMREDFFFRTLVYFGAK